MPTKFRKSETFGSAAIAITLKASRVQAGFRSAAAAALAHGWSENSLRGHESGTRKISRADALKYAEAFNIRPEQLLYENVDKRERAQQLARLEQVKIAAAGREAKQKKEVAARLRFARIVRGFPTLSAATQHLGLNRATAGMHENAINSISERLAEAYSTAYGVTVPWLLHGVLPSGLGPHVDQKLGSKDQDLVELAPECQALATKMATVAPDQLQQQFEIALSRPNRGSADEMYETDVGRHDFQSSDREEGRSWVLPSGLMSKLIGSVPAEVSVIAIDRPQARWMVGDRVFIDSSRRDISVGGHFAYDTAQGIVIEHYNPGTSATGVRTDATLLGKVVASFVWHGKHFAGADRLEALRY